MSEITTETSAMAILRRIVDPEQPFLSTEAAQAILRLDFSGADRARMNALVAKNRAGKLTAQRRAGAEQLHSGRSDVRDLCNRKLASIITESALQGTGQTEGRISGDRPMD